MLQIIKRTYNFIARKVDGRPVEQLGYESDSLLRRGFLVRNAEFIHHSGIEKHRSAVKSVTGHQKLLIIVLLAVLVSLFAIDWQLTLKLLIFVITFLYFADLLFNLFLIYRSFSKAPEITVAVGEALSLDEQSLPTYTVFCPLYKEGNVLPDFVRAIEHLNYPKNKLQVLLLLEEDDKETVRTAERLGLPEFFEIVVVPHSLPKTKPKAMNYGLSKATGEYIVIYDAEDRPEPLQLRRAVAAFARAPKQTACVQAKLNFYNPNQNILTRLFAAEYSLWFDLVLPGLQSMGAPIPLGGTSNHFKTSLIKEIGGWDAFNVTEDCDLGMRLASQGFRTAIVDSTTYEEANSNLYNWYRQRSRWIKGYMQTYLVHMREPRLLNSSLKHPNVLFLQLVVGGKILSMFVNPLLWIVTIVYFTFRGSVAAVIEPYFPAAVLYLGVTSLIFGNFLYLYYYMIGLAKRQNYSIVKFVFLVPLYWIAMSVAAWKALYELITRPHYWQKTVHGLHLPKSGDEDDDGNAPSSGDFLGAVETATALPPEAAMPSAADEVAASANLSVFSGILQRPTAEEVAPDELAPERTEEKSNFKSKFLGWKGEVSSGTWLVVATLVANVLNFLFNAVLGRAISLEDFGVVTLFNTLLALFSVILSGLGGSVNYETSFLLGRGGIQSLNAFASRTAEAVLKVSAVLSLVWIFTSPFVASFFHIEELSLLLFFTPVIVAGSLAAVWSGYLKGRFFFSLYGRGIVYESASKLIFAVLFVIFGFSDWVALSIPASIIVSLVATAYYAYTVKNSDEPDGNLGEISFPFKFFRASIITGLATAVFLNIDVLLAKHFLSATDAGAYSILSLVGKMVYFFGSLLNAFITSVISRHEGQGTDPRKSFHRLLNGTLAFAGIAFLGAGVFGPITVPVLLGENSLGILSYLLPYCLAMALFTVSNTIIAYHVARKRYSFSWLALASTAVIALGFLAMNGTIEDFVEVMLWGSMMHIVLIVLWHAFVTNRHFIFRNLTDLLDLFVPLRQPKVKTDGKRILIFNWRDTKHVFAGGAEVYVHELAKRWVSEGHQVTQFCGSDGKSSREEYVDGVRIIRRGGFYMVYVWAFLYYMLQFRGRFDVVVDCQNGVPFFAPLYVKEPVYCLLHHVHQDVFHKYLIKPLAIFAAFLEKGLMPIVYSQTKFITVSESSKKEMQALGLGRAGIEVIYPGVDLEQLRPGQRAADPLVLYLGRLKAYKSVDVLLKAFRQIKKEVTNARLVIAGSGEELPNLQQLSEYFGYGSSVEFRGKVTDEEKTQLLKQAWVFVNPSMMEGWGITTIEANACGVPVVASNVPGLRDSVKNPHTGFLVPHGDEDALAQRIIELLLDSNKREIMGKEARVWAEKFDWSKSSEDFLGILSENVQTVTITEKRYE